MNEDLKARVTDDPLLKAVIEGLSNARDHLGGERALFGLAVAEKAEAITRAFADDILTALHHAGLLRRSPFDGGEACDVALAVILSRERFPFDDQGARP